MRIEAIDINGFGCHVDKQYTFDAGLNIIDGANESGKSTTMYFIMALLYGFCDDRGVGGEVLENGNGAARTNSSRLPERRRFLPWSGAPYGGSMTLYDDITQTQYEISIMWGSSEADDIRTIKANGEDIICETGKSFGEKLFGIDAESYTSLFFDERRQATVLDIGVATERIYVQGNGAQSQDGDISAQSRSGMWQAAVSRIDGELARLKAEKENGAASYVRINVEESQGKMSAIAKAAHELEQIEAETSELYKHKAEIEARQSHLQSFETLQHAMSIIDKYQRVMVIKTALEELNKEYKKTYYRTVKRRLPLKIITIIPAIAALLFIVLLLLPPQTLPFELSFITSARETLMVSAVIAFTVLAVLTAIIILLAVKGKSRLYELEDEIFYREQALQDELGTEFADVKQSDGSKKSGSKDVQDDAVINELDRKYVAAKRCIEKADNIHGEGRDREEKVAAVNMDIARNEERIKTLSKLLSAAPSYWELYDFSKAANARIAAIEKKEQALILAKELIDKASKQQRESVLPSLANTAQSLFKKFTLERYDSISIAPDYNVIISGNGLRGRSSSSVSGAVADLLTMSFCLSAAQHSNMCEKQLVVLLDDPLSLCDNEHRREALSVIDEYTKDAGIQVIMTRVQNESESA